MIANRNGHIVNISSIYGISPGKNIIIYIYLFYIIIN